MDQHERNKAAAKIHGAGNALQLSGAHPDDVADMLERLASELRQVESPPLPLELEG